MEIEKEINGLYLELADMRKKILSLNPVEEDASKAVLGEEFKRSIDQTLIAYQNKINSINGEYIEKVNALEKQIEGLKKNVQSHPDFTGYKNGEVPSWDGIKRMFVPKKPETFNPTELGDGFLFVKDKKVFGKRMDITDIIPLADKSTSSGPISIKDGKLKPSEYFIEDEGSVQVNETGSVELSGRYIKEAIVHTSIYPKNEKLEPLTFTVTIGKRSRKVTPSENKVLCVLSNIGFAERASVVCDEGDFSHGHVTISFKTIDTHLI